MSRVSDVVMTNDPFDAQEARVWESGAALDARFHAALRMDRAAERLAEVGGGARGAGLPC